LRSGQTARTVSADATAARVVAALGSSNRTIEPVVDERQPEVVDVDLQPALNLGNTLIGNPVVVNGPNGQTWTLSVAALRKMLVIPGSPTAQRDQSLKLDSTKLAAYVADLAKQVDQTPFNARFQRDGAGVRLLQEVIAGRRVDQAKGASLIAAAAAGADRSVALPVDVVAPSITSANADQIAALQLLADNTTSYVGSIPPRRHNVEFATSLLNGVVVAPGEIFSFDHELGPTTLARGFQVGFGIVAQGDAVKTVPSVAGGICQVATTLFQPVFWEGYTIEERYWHAYWIDHYRSRGLVGLDATVDPDGGLDFQFKNDTASPILIQSSADGNNVHFALYGVQPNWRVQVDPPVITNVVKTDRTLQVEYDPTMPKGQQITTEAAQDGFTATIRRTVTDAAGNSRVLNLRSTYAPAHNVVMIGTKP
jgi:vancomycin resistance protein YoaR